MNEFNFSMPVQVYFGEKCVEKNLLNELEKVGSTIMLVYGGGSIIKNGIYEQLFSILKKLNKRIIEYKGITSNPTYKKVQVGAALAREENVDFILAIGGGSVIDCARVIAVQAKANKDLWEQQFVDGKRPDDAIPYGIILTLSGTGSEMNNMAGITHEEIKRKTAVIGTYAKFTMMDPLYTMSVPIHQFVGGVFDSLSHCMETYFGKNNCISDRINESIMKNIIKNARLAIKNPEDVSLRGELMWASSLAIGGIVKAGKIPDFQCHNIEHQLCAYTDCNHGKALAVLHPVVYRHIYKNNLDQFARFAKTVWDIDETNKTKEELSIAGIEALEAFIKEMKMSTTFSELGLKVNDEIYENIANSVFISAGCAKQLDPNEIITILKECK